MTARIAVFAARLAHGIRKAIVETDRRLGGAAWLLLTEGPPLPDGAAPSGSPGEEYRLDRLVQRPNVTYLDRQAADASAAIGQFAPDLGVAFTLSSSGVPLLQAPRLGTLVLHHGKLPQYRGAAPVFWALSNGDPELVCTAASVKTDGAIGVIAEVRIRRQKYSTVAGMELLLDEAAVLLLADCVEKMLAGTVRPLRVVAPGHDCGVPTRGQKAALRRRLEATLPERSGLARRGAKTAYQLSRLAQHGLATAFARRPAIVVLTYHRVNDELRDNVTVGIEQFDRQMALLRRNCDILSIEDVIAGRLPLRSSRPLVCVTFDDGYKDNVTTALPILLRYQVPAAFFVSTGFIGSQRRFPHDLAKGLTDLPTMDWNDLRTLQRHGQIVGSHTVNHIDCARADVTILQDELAASRAALARELGLDSIIFAYPFGQRENMTDAALAQVKQAGYVACLSAYGGVNRSPIDRFDVRRGGINWPFSDLGFLSRARGLA